MAEVKDKSMVELPKPTAREKEDEDLFEMSNIIFDKSESSHDDDLSLTASYKENSIDFKDFSGDDIGSDVDAADRGSEPVMEPMVEIEIAIPSHLLFPTSELENSHDVLCLDDDSSSSDDDLDSDFRGSEHNEENITKTFESDRQYDEPRKCYVCAEVFCTSNQMRRHKLLVHPGFADYKCITCDKVPNRLFFAFETYLTPLIPEFSKAMLSRCTFIDRFS